MLGLEREKFSRGHAGPGQQHDERDGLGFGDGHGRDHRALAVAEEPDAVAVDAGVLAEERYGGQGVLREVGAGGLRDTPGRTADAAIVVAQHGDATTRQVVGDHVERPVVEDLLVAVLWSTSGEEHDGGERPFAFRDGQGAGQRDVVVAKGEVFTRIGKRRLGILRALRRLFGAARQLEREGLPALQERTGDGVAVENPVERGVAGYAGNGEGDGVAGDDDVVERQVPGPLHGNVDGAGPRAVLVPEVHADAERGPGQRDRSVPVPRESGFIGGGRQGRSRQHRYHEQTHERGTHWIPPVESVLTSLILRPEGRNVRRRLPQSPRRDAPAKVPQESPPAPPEGLSGRARERLRSGQRLDRQNDRPVKAGEVHGPIIVLLRNWPSKRPMRSE